MPKPSTNLDKLLSNLRRQFGEEALQWFGDSKVSSLPTFGSGSIGLDKALGGGFPIGRIVEIFGQESSGKTTLCLHAVAEIQQSGKIAAVVDVEHALDVAYASRIGVDLKKLIVSQPNCGEDALRIAEALIYSDGVGLVVVDSVAALTPRAEIDGAIGRRTRGAIKKFQASQGMAANGKTSEALVKDMRRVAVEKGLARPTSEDGS